MQKDCSGGRQEFGGLMQTKILGGDQHLVVFSIKFRRSCQGADHHYLGFIGNPVENMFGFLRYLQGQLAMIETDRRKEGEKQAQDCTSPFAKMQVNQ